MTMSRDSFRDCGMARKEWMKGSEFGIRILIGLSSTVRIGATRIENQDFPTIPLVKLVYARQTTMLVKGLSLWIRAKNAAARFRDKVKRKGKRKSREYEVHNVGPCSKTHFGPPPPSYSDEEYGEKMNVLEALAQ